MTGVVTVELDEVSLRMCARNPWSREMLDSDKITSLQGDCCEASQIEIGKALIPYRKTRTRDVSGQVVSCRFHERAR